MEADYGTMSKAIGLGNLGVVAPHKAKYQALTMIRELMRRGIDFRFASDDKIKTEPGRMISPAVWRYV